MTWRADDYLSALMPPGARFADMNGRPFGASTLYARSSLCRRITDKPALDAFSHGVQVEVDGEGEEGDKPVQDEFDRLKALSKLARAACWARLNGGGALVVLTDESPLMAQPLDVERIGRITELRVHEAADFQVDMAYQDPSRPNFGQPETYLVEVTANAGLIGAAQFRVHESRVIPVAGDPLPREARMMAQIPWIGASAVSSAFDAVEEWTSMLAICREILKKKQQPVHGMSGLTEMLGRPGGEAMVRSVVGNIDKVRTFLNTVVVDALDKFDVHDLSITGLRELLEQAQIAVAAQCGIPVSILFGRSAAGMNATGEGDFQGYDDLVKSERTDRAQPALERLITLITKQAHVRGKIPGTWRIEWPPLRNLTDQEQADVGLKKAQAEVGRANALNAYVSNGVLSAEEVRVHLADGDNEYGIDPNKEIEPPEPSDAELSAALGLNGNDQQTAPRPGLPGRP